jgi:photosystem II stability/assembly factor-like uncharacterized protein
MKKFTFFAFTLLFFLIVHCIPIRRMWLIGISTAIAVSTFNIDNCMCQWIYQSLPSYHSVTDIKFFDENTGILIYHDNQTTYGMLKTTNGGFNWFIVTNYIYYYDMQKIDSITMYLVGVRNTIFRIQRTFDRGQTWDSVSFVSSGGYTGLSFINRDTGWISGANYLSYNCIWKTTNGGVTLIQQTDTTGIGKIFFLKNKVNGEYYGWHYDYSYGDYTFWKTTNSGNNWFKITRPSQYCSYLEFFNENTGWHSGGSNIYKTTNGGLNWILQSLPVSGILGGGVGKFKIINIDTIYGVGGNRHYGGPYYYGIIWKTTNGGMNWGYEAPDTTFPNGDYGAIDFINSNTGWAYQGNGIHTTNGGGPIIFTDIHSINSEIPKLFVLYQNYPNPFNSMTNIKYKIGNTEFRSSKLEVSIILFDILGKEIATLVNEKKSPGIYNIKFNGNNFASGIYLYSLLIDGIRVDTKKLMLIK